MPLRRVWLITAALALATAIAVLVVDAPLARAIGDGGGEAVVEPALHALEVITLLDVHRFLFADLLIAAGLVILVARRRLDRLGSALFIIGVTNVATRLLTTELKDATGRFRPSEILRGAEVGTLGGFGDGGIAFPSGHVAHFAGLLLPLAFLYPRLAAPAAALVAFVAAARMATNDHFLGDTLGAITLASGVAAILVTLRTRAHS